jgi:hypothetical protein
MENHHPQMTSMLNDDSLSMDQEVTTNPSIPSSSLPQTSPLFPSLLPSGQPLPQEHSMPSFNPLSTPEAPQGYGLGFIDIFRQQMNMQMTLQQQQMQFQMQIANQMQQMVQTITQNQERIVTTLASAVTQWQETGRDTVAESSR